MSTSDNLQKEVLSSLTKLSEGQKQHENYLIEQYRNVTSNPASLKSFYEEKLLIDTWLLYSEALPFCVGAESGAWNGVKNNHARWAKEVSELITPCLGHSLKVINPQDPARKQRVIPSEFINWLDTKGQIPRQELLDVLADKKSSNDKSRSSVHGNSERHAQKREQVLKAALSAVVNFPEECKSRGKFSGTAITRLIERKSTLWFGYEELPLSQRKMESLINEALKID